MAIVNQTLSLYTISGVECQGGPCFLCLPLQRQGVHAKDRDH